MHLAPKTSVLLLWLFFTCGCNATHLPTAQQKSFPAMEAFKQRVAGHEFISFRSNNGIAYRMDGDTELIFYPNGDAVMLEWGLSGIAYRGNYRLREDGNLVSRFKDFPDEWPTMLIEQEGESIRIRPRIMPNGGALGEGFWQFRMLTGDDEATVLVTAKAWLVDSPP